VRCDFARETNILLSGEILNEHIAGDVNLIQPWGAPWCGIDIDLLDRVSPISKLLFLDITFYGHLG